MTRLFSWLLITLSLSVSEEVRSLITPTQQINEEARDFLESLMSQSSDDTPTQCHQCSSSRNSKELKSNLMIFMSFSVPLESWLEWSYAIEKKGGIFVLKGLPDNSFQAFARKVQELKAKGVYAPICIDPQSYEKYQIDAVPAVLLIEGDTYDKIQGNIFLETALRKFAQEGSCKPGRERALKK